MKISIIGSNGMLAIALAKYYLGQDCNEVLVYGLRAPEGYGCTKFFHINLLNDRLEYDQLLQSDVIFYASGAGIQSTLNTEASLMYALNVNVPIEITLQLKKRGYNGIFVTYGSYMEIGANPEIDKSYTEDEVVCSLYPATNDYALSKRLFGRYMHDFHANYKHYHFILPNMFSEDDLRPGTRLVPYTLQYLQAYKRGEVVEAPCFSAGLQTRQFITLEEMIDTVNEAIIKAIPSGLYNVGGGEFLSIRNLIERLFAIYQVPCSNEYFGQEVRRDDDTRCLRIDGRKLQKYIGRLPNKTIEDIFSI